MSERDKEIKKWLKDNEMNKDDLVEFLLEADIENSANKEGYDGDNSEIAYIQKVALRKTLSKSKTRFYICPTCSRSI